ncbi:ABC transporter permease [Humibacter ginsenosidimutans]|uniref:ABC transporter permease n=1 Tax=Humibacter ginsenosidimutans TaxID=2599293 RepID=A0A5B8M5F5_9MICO|nr:ABC transporter permease [Humibacter ginsenosidimutans]QDZ15299.1 ABC transporter permease [Humibacter ginsenosidimutans]
MTETTASSTLERPPIGLALRSLLRADTIVLLRSRVATVLALVLPVAILIATSFARNGNKLGDPALVIGLALTLGLLTSCMLGYSLNLARDREIGVLQRLRVTPAPTWTIMTSRIAVQVVTNLVASLIVVVVGVILHGLTLSVGQYLLVVAIAALGAAVFLSIGQAIVGLVTSTGAVNAIGRILFILLVLLGILGGTGILGDTIQVIAEWSPVGALMTLFNDAVTGSGWTSQDAYSLPACIGYVVVFAFIGIRWFRWETR